MKAAQAEKIPDSGITFDADAGILIGLGKSECCAGFFDPADSDFDIAIIVQGHCYQFVEHRIVEQIPPHQVDVNGRLVGIEPIFCRDLHGRRHEIWAQHTARKKHGHHNRRRPYIFFQRRTNHCGPACVSCDSRFFS
jgi:hypothetical protein